MKSAPIPTLGMRLPFPDSLSTRRAEFPDVYSPQYPFVSPPIGCPSPDHLRVHIMLRNTLPMQGAASLTLCLGFMTAGSQAGPPSDRAFKYYYEPSYFGYDLMDTHPGYYGG